ncbi:MAG: VOC family protein [Cyclobacteriaceae bacterium]|nr:VOC family protein [Cyclobacteriaceae bacterium]
MKLEHIAIYTTDLENLRAFYLHWFGGQCGARYNNSVTGFTSYFLRFDSGARLELMSRPDLVSHKDLGLAAGIAHIAFCVDNREDVDSFAEKLKAEAWPIVRGPRITGDGYYELEMDDPDGNRIEIIFSPFN